MMHFPRLVVLLTVLIGVLAPMPAVSIATAQETTQIPPLPRPRPDRNAPPAPAPAPPAAELATPATDAITALTSAPQPITLTARITPESAPLPSGLVWRIFDSTPGANGEMALVAKAETGIASFELPPGEYVVHVAYGNAQVKEDIALMPGPNTVDIVLNAGALRLNAEVTGDIPISPALLRFDVFTAGPETDRVMIAENLAPNEIITVVAGTYQIVSRFGSINAVVRADLRVEPGQITDATLFHHASEVSFKLVSEEGGEAIADVEWTVKTSDGATVFTERGAFASTVLGEGEYLVLAKLGEQVYNRDVQIQAGGPREIEVLSSIY